MTTTPLAEKATYTPRIVWSTGTSLDTSAYNDVSQSYLSSPGLIVDGIGRDQDRAYSPPKAPAFDLTLTNWSQVFSPGGVLANFLGRGAAVTLDSTYGTDVLVDATDVLVDDPSFLTDGYMTKRLFTGTSIQMQQAISRGERTVAVSALGTTSALLVSKKPLTPLYESIRTDQAITAILDWVGWDSSLRTIDTGATTLTYWWLNGQTTAISAINALLAADGAGSCFYEDCSGVAHFESRNFRSTNSRSLNTQNTFFDGTLSASAIVDDPAYLVDATDVLVDGPLPSPLYHIIPAQYTSNPDEVVKSVTATVNVRTATSVQKIWEYGSTITLTANQVLDVPVTSSDPFKSAVTPAAATDYTVSAGALAAVSLLTTSGQTATLRLTAGAAGATVLGVTSNGIQVRAVSLPVSTTNIVTSTVDTTSTAPRYAAQDPLELQAWPEVSNAQMLDIVNSMALRYRRERRQVSFKIRNLDAAHMYAILTTQISDRVRFVHTHAQLDILLWVEQLHYEIAPGGGVIILTIGGEQVFDLSGGVFDTAKYDTAVYGL